MDKSIDFAWPSRTSWCSTRPHSRLCAQKCRGVRWLSIVLMCCKNNSLLPGDQWLIHALKHNEPIRVCMLTHYTQTFYACMSIEMHCRLSVYIHFYLFFLPTCFKSTSVTPILKKPRLDPYNLNFRLIFKLLLFSKIWGNIVAAQLQHVWPWALWNPSICLHPYPCLHHQLSGILQWSLGYLAKTGLTPISRSRSLPGFSPTLSPTLTCSPWNHTTNPPSHLQSLPPPDSHCSFRDRVVSVAATTLWNSLPNPGLQDSDLLSKPLCSCSPRFWPIVSKFTYSVS